METIQSATGCPLQLGGEFSPVFFFCLVVVDARLDLGSLASGGFCNGRSGESPFMLSHVHRVFQLPYRIQRGLAVQHLAAYGEYGRVPPQDRTREESRGPCSPLRRNHPPACSSSSSSIWGSCHHSPLLQSAVHLIRSLLASLPAAGTLPWPVPEVPSFLPCPDARLQTAGQQDCKLRLASSALARRAACCGWTDLDLPGFGLPD
ncbi:hypothetical protein J3F83DRAFT_614755 [Trichoderma novae-zelandiae]